jgi:hypothetical protein
MGISHERKVPAPKLAIGGVETPLNAFSCFSDVRYWHEAGIGLCTANVCF